MKKYTEPRPKEQCNNCKEVGGVIVWIHETLPFSGQVQRTEGLRDCTKCRGLPQ